MQAALPAETARLRRPAQIFGVDLCCSHLCIVCGRDAHKAPVHAQAMCSAKLGAQVSGREPRASSSQPRAARAPWLRQQSPHRRLLQRRPAAGNAAALWRMPAQRHLPSGRLQLRPVLSVRRQEPPQRQRNPGVCCTSPLPSRVQQVHRRRGGHVRQPAGQARALQPPNRCSSARQRSQQGSVRASRRPQRPHLQRGGSQPICILQRQQLAMAGDSWRT